MLAGLAMRFRLFDRAIEWTGDATGLNLNGIFALLILAPLASALFARRRYREALGVRRELVRLSLHDPLTGLPNRTLLADWLATDIRSSQHHNAQAAVFFVDLDKFKHVNDTHGHEVGDRLMRSVAERMRAMMRPEDRIIRFGGDEFVILCPDVASSGAAEKIAHRVIEIVEQPFVIGDETLRISASIGVALAEHHGVKPEDVLRDADVAMYQAKAHGSGHVAIFDRSMKGRLTPATAEEQIRSALEAGEFHLHYQPVIEMSSGRIVGAEALLRWISPDRGTMSPAEFIPILEETGLIVPVGTWVLEEACREAARVAILADGSRPPTITVNVSARQLARQDFGDRVAAALEAAGIRAEQIHLEITEGALMHDVTSAWAVLRQAKALGVKLALDDFGTGYSSLSYVRRFALDMLKIDKSFIDGVDSSPEDRAIVDHVVGMAHALGMVTVAEGVERPEQLAWLRRLGCQLAQGYAISRPLPGGDFEAILARHEIDPFGIGAHTGDGPARTAESAPADPPVGPLECLAPLGADADVQPSRITPWADLPLAPAPTLVSVASEVPSVTTAPLEPPAPRAGSPARTTPARTTPLLPRMREFRPADADEV